MNPKRKLEIGVLSGAVPSAVLLTMLLMLASCGADHGEPSSGGDASEQVDPSDPAPAFRLRQVGEGVTVALRPRLTRFDDGNSGLLAGSKGFLVVDAPADTEVIDAWIRRAEEEGLPIRWVVNTHWHADHVQNNHRIAAAFPESVILGHRTLTRDIPERAARDHAERVERLSRQVPAALEALAEGKGLSGQTLDDELLEAQRRSIEQAQQWLDLNQDVQFLAPTEVFDDQLEVDVGGLSVQLLHFEAHTSGDTVVFIPERRIAFTGDLLDELPFVGHGYPNSWINALTTLEQMPVDIYIPGHGDPFGKDHLQKIRAFLMAVVATVDDAKAKGLTVEQAVEANPLGEWCSELCPDQAARQFFEGTVGQAIEAAWNSADA